VNRILAKDLSGLSYDKKCQIHAVLTENKERSAISVANTLNPDAFFGGLALRVLAMASQKGGSGKTTLSGHLGVQAQRAGAGPVVLIDIDPKGSLADWWNEREAELSAFAQTTVARLHRLCRSPSASGCPAAKGWQRTDARAPLRNPIQAKNILRKQLYPLPCGGGLILRRSLHHP
jgi:hypothetical protein